MNIMSEFKKHLDKDIWCGFSVCLMQSQELDFDDHCGSLSTQEILNNI